MKKNNKLETAYSKIFNIVKTLDDEEMSVLIESVYAGYVAWRGLRQSKILMQEHDAIDKIEEDLTKKGKKK